MRTTAGTCVLERLGPLALAVALLGGCAGGGSVSKASADQAPATLRQEVERLREEVAGLQARIEATRLASVQHADQVVRGVRAELEATQDVLRAMARHSDQRQGELLDVQENRLARLERQTADLTRTLRGIEASVSGLVDQVARQEALPAQPSGPPVHPRAAGQDARLTGVRAPTPGPPSAPREPKVEAQVEAKVDGGAPHPPAGAPAPQELFDAGLRYFRKGEHGQAALEFAELVRTYPSDALAGAAQFWIGEAYFLDRDFEQAAVEYRKTLDLAPKGKEAPQALLKLGLSYRAGRREALAREAWTRLIRDFPRSDAADRARKALQNR